MSSKTDLREAQRLAGGAFLLGDPEVTLPLDFGSPADEYSAAVHSAGLFDHSDRVLIEMTGADRATFLHNFCTNEVKRLSAGQGCEALVTNVKGRIVGHVWIDVGETAIWLDSSAGSAERLVAHLERYVINEDVTIADRSALWGELLVMGPQAAAKLADLNVDAASLEALEHRNGELGRVPVRVRRFDVGMHRGYVLAARCNQLATLWKQLCGARFQAGGSVAWNGLRIEGGLPLFGVDISDENLAQEAGRTRTAISFTKGCYLGQEPVARIDAMGHVNRELRSLRLESGPVPRRGDRIFSDAAASQAVGAVSSSGISFDENVPIAMGLLRSSVAAPGTRVFVESVEGRVAAATVFWQPLIGD